MKVMSPEEVDGYPLLTSAYRGFIFTKQQKQDLDSQLTECFLVFI